MTRDEDQAIPPLDDLRAAFSDRISLIVDFFVRGKHRSASVGEICDGVCIDNAAERETVYSSLDPYTDGAAKRDPKRPLLFKRENAGEYEFLGYEGDCLQLTTRAYSRVPLYGKCYEVVEHLFREQGKINQWRERTLPEKLSILHGLMKENPRILATAQLLLKHEMELAELVRNLPPYSPS